MLLKGSLGVGYIGTEIDVAVALRDGREDGVGRGEATECRGATQVAGGAGSQQANLPMAHSLKQTQLGCKDQDGNTSSHNLEPVVFASNNRNGFRHLPNKDYIFL